MNLQYGKSKGYYVSLNELLKMLYFIFGETLTFYLFSVEVPIIYERFEYK